MRIIGIDLAISRAHKGVVMSERGEFVTYDQMVNKGKHHNQAGCTVTTHLLDRVFVILTEDRPYELRDVDGTPVSPKQARAIVAEKYTVPEEVRKRNNRKARQASKEQRAERQFSRREKRREGPPDWVRG